MNDFLETYRLAKAKAEKSSGKAIKKYVDEIRQINIDLKKIEQDLSLKQAEFERTGLDKAIASLSEQLNLLNAKIANSSDQIAQGKLSTSDFLEAKACFKSTEDNLADLKEAKKIQDAVIASFHQEMKPLKARLYQLRRALKIELIDTFISKLFDHSKDQIDEVLNIFIASTGLAEGIDTYKRIFNEIGFRLYGKYEHFPSYEESCAFSEKVIDDLVSSEQINSVFLPLENQT